MPSWFVALLAGPAVLIPLAAYCMAHQRVKGARWYGLLLVIIAWWSLAYAWELSARDPEAKLLALRVKYFAVAALPVAWIGFILDFVGSDPLRVRQRVRPLVAVSVIVLAVLWTDRWHGLFWGAMTVHDIGPYVVLQGRGPGFWVNVAYTYVVLAGGLVLLVRHAVDSPYLYRTRALTLVAGTIVPWAGNVVFMLHREETIFDPTPFLFTCTALIAALAVFRYDLLEPVPTLRDARIGSVGDGVIILDRRRRVADLNAAAEALIGRRRAEAAGTVIDEMLPSWPAGALPDGPLDLTLERRAGTQIFDVRCSAVRSLAGGVSGTIVILRDVTERRASEAALRESEHRYRAVIEQAFDAVWLTDVDGTVIDANPQACALLEHEPHGLVGSRAADILECADQASWAPDPDALRRGEALSWERPLVTRSGRVLLLAGRSKQIGATLVVSTFRDITEERAHALLRERLLEEAQTASRLKDEYLATVSHELRTPLNAVVGWTHMLLRRQVDAPRVAHALSVIERNTLAQVRLVEDLLDVSGLADGHARLALRPSSLADIIREAVDGVAPTASAKAVVLDVAVPPDLPPIQADPDRFRQVIWNLLTNAIKFTPSGGRISLSVALGADHIAITVADTGQGIEADFLPHVFDAFRQEDSSARGSRGLGLGLTIVRRIVEAHGGTVRAESNGPGRGSTFRIRVPFT